MSNRLARVQPHDGAQVCSQSQLCCNCKRCLACTELLKHRLTFVLTVAGVCSLRFLSLSHTRNLIIMVDKGTLQLGSRRNESGVSTWQKVSTWPGWHSLRISNRASTLGMQ